MTTTFPPFFTGMMIVLISHFLLKHYLLYLPHEASFTVPGGVPSEVSPEYPYKKKKVRFRLPHEESPLAGTVQSTPKTFETVDVKGELLKFVKDYGKDDYSAMDDTSHVADTDDLKEFFEIGTEPLNVLDITRDIEPPKETDPFSLPKDGQAINGFDSFEMNDTFALYGTNST